MRTLLPGTGECPMAMGCCRWTQWDGDCGHPALHGSGDKDAQGHLHPSQAFYSVGSPGGLRLGPPKANMGCREHRGHRGAPQKVPSYPKDGVERSGRGRVKLQCMCVCVCAAPEPTALVPSLSPGGTRLSGDSGDRGQGRDPLPLSQLGAKFERSRRRRLPRGRELWVSLWGRGVCPTRPVGWDSDVPAWAGCHPRSRWGDAGSAPTASRHPARGWGLEGSGPQHLPTSTPNPSPTRWRWLSPSRI